MELGGDDLGGDPLSLGGDNANDLGDDTDLSKVPAHTA